MGEKEFVMNEKEGKETNGNGTFIENENQQKKSTESELCNNGLMEVGSKNGDGLGSGNTKVDQTIRSKIRRYSKNYASNEVGLSFLKNVISVFVKQIGDLLKGFGVNFVLEKNNENSEESREQVASSTEKEFDMNEKEGKETNGNGTFIENENQQKKST